MCPVSTAAFPVRARVHAAASPVALHVTYVSICAGGDIMHQQLTAECLQMPMTDARNSLAPLEGELFRSHTSNDETVANSIGSIDATVSSGGAFSTSSSLKAGTSACFKTFETAVQTVD